ncbi:hypothetical protein [Chryseosolibacter indicus]|uniref:Uncharacterized protein n=1 Tax=Chryseosolibacter indicus TaxID=2782351 RepID=A0ABS5VPL9_9BACT|nr:hypothetical protein [Chryseosolibacter indicus]MBT1703091.1 hypothetical protein [Chryseosolibacter indicus]
MKRVVAFLLLISLFSCKEVSFKEAQPVSRRPLVSVPKILRGKYLTYKENGELAKDTVIINSMGYRFGYFSPEERTKATNQYDDGVLSDSMVLKSYKGYYFLSLNQKPEWILRVIKLQKNGDLLYMAPEQPGVNINEYIKRLSTLMPVDSTRVNDKTIYQIDPSPQQLIDLIEEG